MKKTLTTVSLFSGAGGSDCGFTLMSKYRMLLANELKEAPSETFAYNFGLKIVHAPAKPKREDFPLIIQGDIGDVRFSELNGLEPDVLHGGPPCQDFSVIKAGVRKGIEVKRGRLYSHFIRALTSMKPKVFIFENVPGLVSANNHQAYGVILEDFAKLNIRWSEIKEVAHMDNNQKDTEKPAYEILFSGIVDMSKLGVPQARKRLIIVGLRSDITGRMNLFKWRGLQERFKYLMNGEAGLLCKYPLTIMEVFEGKPLCDLNSKYKSIMLDYKMLWEEFPMNSAKEWKVKVWDNLKLNVMDDYFMFNSIAPKNQSEVDAAMVEHEQILNRLGYLKKPVANVRPSDNSNATPAERDSVVQRMRRIPPGENHNFVRGSEWEVEGRGISLIYKRAFPIRPSPTVVAFGGGGTWGYHYKRDRAMLTNRERARVQTFPDSFLFKGGKGEIRAQIGEAVPPLFASYVADAISDVLGIM